MCAKFDLHSRQTETLKRIWLEQARKFSGHANDLRDFIRSAHKWSDIWHATVWGIPDAEQQKGLLHAHTSSRVHAHKGRCARVKRQTYRKKMNARFPGTAGHRQR